ncbi:MAG: Glycosyl transferase group 1 [Candidatus Curtissbacteria bacterium GW2011_GWA1_40_16]|uniref:Glycosyl transferase group 1 n=1 Tax=Candidatus Curtissbacteria bacterium GW2011_GWA1_40_16 TaxID=1618405 RepID=A0A0G0TRE9_9BACT|nr:MAG: Glycosyl transferase group 1 [Candidatus Curtissbacteria bacterium GW2011_GWA1_40_16]
MRIAVIIDTWFPFVGGGQINAWEISKRLAQRGNQVEIITRNCGRDNLQTLKNLKVTKLGKPSKAGDDVSRLKFLLHALVYISRKDIDVIVAHAFLPGLIARLLILIKKRPAILVVHGTSVGTGLNQGPKAFLEKFILTQIRYSAEITVSRDFLKIKNINNNIVYIPNGVDPLSFRTNSSIKREKNSLLFVGRLHPQKNLINLIEAIKLLDGENLDVKLTIVGDGPLKQEVADIIKKYKLAEKIKLVGAKDRSELSKFYNSASAFILPSIYEGQALTLLEAWAAKMPVIVTRTGDNTYLVKEGVNGYFIGDKNNPESIAKAIKETLGNKNLNKIGKNGYNLVKENYNWNKSMMATKTLFETLV